MKSGMARFAGAILAVLVLTAGPAVARSLPDWAEEALGAKYLESYGDADAVVVLDSWDIEVHDGERVGTRRWIVHVLTEDGVAESYLRLYSGSFNRFSRVKAWVRDPDGRVTVRSQEDGTLLSPADLQILDDTEVLIVDPGRVQPGAVVAVEHRFRFDRELPQNYFRIQRDVPVWTARVAVETRGGWRVLARVAGGENPGPAEFVDAGSWTFSRVDALAGSEEWRAPEPPALELTLDYAPPGGRPAFPDWAATARWLIGLFGPPSGPTPLLDRVTTELRDLGGDVVASVGKRVRAMRYFGIEIGWGGWRPRSPETTLRRAFGDCKDKSHLMSTLLRRLGVEAYPVLVLAPRHGYVHDDLPSPFHFDHCIVGIPWGGREREPGMMVVEDPVFGQVRLYDPTPSDAFSGDVPTVLEGGAALVIRADSTALLRIPRSAARDNVRETVHRESITDGTLRETWTRRLSGAMAVEILDDDGEVLDDRTLRTEIAREILDVHPGFENLQVERPHREGPGTWIVEASFSVPSGLADYGGVRALPLQTLLDHGRIPLPDEDKPETRYLAQRFMQHDLLMLDLGDSEPPALPESFEVENAVGHVSFSARLEGGRVKVDREVAVETYEIPPEKRDDAVALRRAVRRANDAMLVFPPGQARADLPGS